MKATNKLSHFFLMVIFLAASVATAAHADSFVSDSTMEALKDFQFGQTVASSSKTDKAADTAFEGDSFISAAAMEALEDFQFGFEGYHAPRTVATAANGFAGDSFVNAETVDELEGFVLFESKRAEEASLSHVDTEL